MATDTKTTEYELYQNLVGYYEDLINANDMDIWGRGYCTNMPNPRSQALQKKLVDKATKNITETRHALGLGEAGSKLGLMVYRSKQMQKSRDKA